MTEPTASRSLLPTCPPIDGPLAYRATETAERSYREWKAGKQAAQRKLLQQEADLAKTLQLHVRTPQLLPVYLRARICCSGYASWCAIACGESCNGARLFELHYS